MKSAAVQLEKLVEFIKQSCFHLLQFRQQFMSGVSNL